MIIQGVTLRGVNVRDVSLSYGALLYLDPGNTNSYSGTGTTWTDLSTNTNNATLVGSPTFTNAGTGSYFTFDGTGSQYASTVTSKYNQTYTGKTIMIALRPSSSAWTNGVDQFRGIFGTTTGSRNFNTYLRHDSSNNIQLHYSSAGGGGFSNNITLTANTWYVITVTQTTGGLVTYYLNGVAVGTNTGITFAQYASSSTENVGRTDNNWYGDIGVTLVYGRALSAGEVLQNYRDISAQYSMVSTNLVAYYNPDLTTSYPGTGTTLYDISGNGLNGTMSNITYTDPYFTYNGTNSQVSIADNALLEPGSGSWTMEVWVNQTVSGNDVVLGKFDPGGLALDTSYSIRTTGTSYYAQIGSGSGSGSTLFINSTTFVGSLNTWYQLVYVFKNGATKTLETFVNGSSIGTVNHSLASILNTPSNLYLGSYNNGEFAQWFDGKIGITRLYSSALTSTQVLQNYNANRGLYGL